MWSGDGCCPLHLQTVILSPAPSAPPGSCQQRCAPALPPARSSLPTRRAPACAGADIPASPPCIYASLLLPCPAPHPCPQASHLTPQRLKQALAPSSVNGSLAWRKPCPPASPAAWPGAHRLPPGLPRPTAMRRWRTRGRCPVGATRTTYCYKHIPNRLLGSVGTRCRWCECTVHLVSHTL